MIITVASYKGGVGKTTTAVHLAAFLQTLAPTLLLDGDDTRNATAWSKRGKGFSFKSENGGQTSRPGVGILGMRERVHRLGGTLEISSDGSGTHVLASLPIHSVQSTAVKGL